MRGRDGDSIVSVGPIDKAEHFQADGKVTLLITESEVERLHGRRLPDFPKVLVERGEAAKSVEGLEALWSAFLDAGLDRNSRVLAVGGGAVSDLSGFAASTWMRGISFEYMPTTLLAMVDAAVGGKTAIDFRGRKNLVGVFCQPRRVLCDVAFLDTLPDVEFASGMGEVIKHAFLSGGDYLEFVEGLGGKRPLASSLGGRANLEAIVAGSITYKAGIVNRDEREEEDRRLLNLGHTFGHAIESTLGIPHGHAVAAGLATASRLAELQGGTRPGLVPRIIALLRAWGLPSSFEEAIALSGRSAALSGRSAALSGRSAALSGRVRALGSTGLGETELGEVRLREAIAGALGADKKRAGDEVRFVLPRGPAQMEMVGIALSTLEDFAREAP
ncbi:MAG: 3-dehydroquinate synthase [Treponema sp.]|nr:3-dehydroquinate synthase [Treponema sp.]